MGAVCVIAVALLAPVFHSGLPPAVAKAFHVTEETSRIDQWDPQPLPNGQTVYVRKFQGYSAGIASIDGVGLLIIDVEAAMPDCPSVQGYHWMGCDLVQGQDSDGVRLMQLDRHRLLLWPPAQEIIPQILKDGQLTATIRSSQTTLMDIDFDTKGLPATLPLAQEQAWPDWVVSVLQADE